MTTTERETVPKRLKGKVKPEVWHDTVLFYKTVEETAHRGLRPPTWIEWVKEWTLLDSPANTLPDPLDELDRTIT